jgi:hypothetical protein
MKRIGMTKCEWPGCDDTGIKGVYGTFYCDAHYYQAVFSQLRKRAASGEVSKQLRNLLGRWVEYWAHNQDEIPDGLGALSKAKIEQRAQIRLESSSIVFGIERHRKPIAVTHWFRLDLLTWDIEDRGAVPLYLTVADFAEKAKVSEDDVRQMVEQEGLEAVTVDEVVRHWLGRMWDDGRHHITGAPNEELYQCDPENTLLIPHSEVERFRSKK